MADKKTPVAPEDPASEKTLTEEVPSSDEKAQKRANAVILCVVCCTALTIASQFVAMSLVERDFKKTLAEIEYGKVGWESNYRLLQEIQRDRTSTYLKDLEEKEPSYIRSIKRKIEGGESAWESKRVGKLLPEEVEAFRSTLPTWSWSDAKTTVVEFSDFSCPFCKEYHESRTAKNVAEAAESDYALKILPNKKYEGSEFFARAAKCVLRTSGSGAYLEFADETFVATGSVAQSAYASAKKAGIEKAALDECAQSAETSALIAKDSWQGMYLKIRMTPSVLVLNNETGEYAVLSGEPDERTLRAALAEITTTKEAAE